MLRAKLAIGLIVAAAVGVTAYRAYLRERCDDAILHELHWEWRLRTSEVQNSSWLKEVTERMYRKSQDERIKKCREMYEAGAQ
jgi:hypothetical protein